MDLVWLIAVVAIAVVVALIVVVAVRQRQRAHLKKRFGPEYEHAVRTTGNPAKAEAELVERERRVASLNIRPLTGAQRDRFAESWKRLQAQFVDDPRGTITQVDRLVGEVMEARGYPLSEFEQLAADISVNHPHVVENYRAARAIAVRHTRGEASTEDLRQAMVHCRALFADLLETTPEPDRAGTRRR